MSLSKQLDNLFSEDILLENIEKKKPFIMQQLENGLKKDKIKYSKRNFMGEISDTKKPPVARDIFMWIVNMDPTVADSKGQKSEYVNYILSWLLDGSVILGEDDGKVKEAIDKIIDLKTTYPKKFNDVLKNNQGKLSLKDLNAINPESFELNDYEESLLKAYDQELEKVWENGSYKIYKVDRFIPAKELKDKYCEKQGVHKFFAFTKWCVRCEDTFNHYEEEFYMVLENNKRKALIHFGTGQAKDINDDEVDREFLFKLKPFLNEHVEEINFSKESELAEQMINGLYEADLLLNSFEKNGLEGDDYGKYNASNVLETLLDVYLKQKPISDRMRKFALKEDALTLFHFYSNNKLPLTDDMINYIESLNAEEMSDYIGYIPESKMTEKMFQTMLANDDSFLDIFAYYGEGSSLLTLPKRIKEYFFKFLEKTEYTRTISHYIGNIIRKSNRRELLEEFDERIIKYMLALLEKRSDNTAITGPISDNLYIYLEKITKNFKEYSGVPFLKELYNALLPFRKESMALKGFTGTEGFKEALEKRFYK